MNSVEQIHQLESRIERVLQRLAELRAANASLTAELQAANARAGESVRKLEESERARLAAEQELQDREGKLSQLRTDQEEIEATINRALLQLDELEADQPEPAPSSLAAPAATEAEPAEEQAATATVADAPAAPTVDEPPEPQGQSVAPAEAASEEHPAAAAPAATTEEKPPEEQSPLDIF